MKRALLPPASLLACALAITATGCSSGGDLSTSGSQLQFGVRMAQQDLWREARFRFQRAIELDPGNAMARNNLAVSLEGIGEFEKAKALYLEALKLDSGNQYIQKNYSRFMEFYTRNEKRDKVPAAGAAAATTPSTPPSVSTAPAPPPPGATPGPPVTPPPTTPTTLPPTTPKPLNGGAR